MHREIRDSGRSEEKFPFWFFVEAVWGLIFVFVECSHFSFENKVMREPTTREDVSNLWAYIEFTLSVVRPISVIYHSTS